MSRFTAADDRLHDVSDQPDARESLAFAAPVPDEGLLVFAYVWRDPTTERFGRYVAVAEDRGGEPTVLSAADGVALEGDDLDDCAVAGLRVRQPEPLRTAEIAFADDEVDVALTFAGVHEPFSWHENEAGCPVWAAKDRYEQSCRVTGTVRFGAREVAVDTHGQRDHSWGTRDWRALQHWKWINAAADDDHTLHAMVSIARGDVVVNGYVNRGGTVVPLVGARVAHELDDRVMHRTVTATLEDAGGGTTTLEVERDASWRMPVGHLYLNEAAMSGTLDGRPAVAHVEMGWPQAYADAYAGG